MTISSIGTTAAASSVQRIRFAAGADTASDVQLAIARTSRRRRLSLTLDKAVQLGRAVDRVQRLIEANGRDGIEAIRRPARSRSALGLTQPAHTTLESTEEVNTVATSFSPFGPAFVGGSTTEATIGGQYTGATDDVLTFRARDGRTIGGNQQVRFEIRNGEDQRIETFIVKKFDPPGTVYTTNQGLTVSFSAGATVKGDTFTVNVSASEGSRVDPDKPFDGIRNDNPNLEPGFAITAGSFEVNGVTINVAADDTLNAVLARITASAANVDAEYDPATDQVQLTRKTAGSESITVENDTSGFLAATKLDTAVSQTGEVSQHTAAIASVPQLAGISAGTLQVNGASISIDPAVDSLADVLERINQSSHARAIATFDTSTNRVEIRGSGSTRLDVQDGTSGFFSGVQITPGDYGQGTAGFSGSDELLQRLEELEVAFDELLGGETGGTTFANGGPSVAALLQDAVTNSFAFASGGLRPSGDVVRTGLGIDFRFGFAGDGFQIRFDDAVETLEKEPNELFDFLLPEGKDERQGLLARLSNVAKTIEDRITLERGSPRGLLIDVGA